MATEIVLYDYYVNLDERGEFNADVRDPETEETIFEIHDADQLSEMIEDGFMRHSHDTYELENYLKELGIIEKYDAIALAN